MVKPLFSVAVGRGARGHGCPAPVKISYKKMAAKGGRIDFMFLGPSYPSIGSATGFHNLLKDTYFCTAFVLRFKRFGLTHLNNISRCSAYYIRRDNCMEASFLLVSDKIHQTYPFCVSRVVLNKVRQILKRIAHLRSPYSRIRTFFALCKKFNSDMR